MDCTSLQSPVYFTATPAPSCQTELVCDLKNKHIPGEELRRRRSSVWLSLWICPLVSMWHLLPDASHHHWLSITLVSPSPPEAGVLGEKMAHFLLVVSRCSTLVVSLLRVSHMDQTHFAKQF